MIRRIVCILGSMIAGGIIALSNENVAFMLQDILKLIGGWFK